MPKMTRLPDRPGLTGLRTLAQNMPLPNTVMDDYKLKFQGVNPDLRISLFVDDAAPKKGPGPWWYGVAVRANQAPGSTLVPVVLPLPVPVPIPVRIPLASGNTPPPLYLDTVHVFFHPTPKQGGYEDADFADGPDGHWLNLCKKYVEMIGLQVAAYYVPQLLIVPIVPMSGLGAFVAQWQDVVTQIIANLGYLYDPYATTAQTPAPVRQVVVSSFSSGINYLNAFIASGVGVRPLLRAIVDLDGNDSDSRTALALSSAFASTKPVTRVIAYDQVPVTSKGPFFTRYGQGLRLHVPGDRWSPGADGKVRSVSDTHGTIPTSMLYDGLTKSGVGYY